MSKKNRSKNIHPKTKKITPKDLRLKGVVLPFEEVDHEEVKKTIADLGEQKGKEYPELVKKLEMELRRYNPFLALAIICNYGLTQLAGSVGFKPREAAIKSFNQHHAEFLQAQVLSIPLEEINSKMPNANDIGLLFKLLIEISDAFHLRRLTNISSESNTKVRSEKRLQELIRCHTQVVRNWGHYEEVVSLSTQMLKYVEDRSSCVLDWRPSNAVKLFNYILSRIESRSSQRLRLLNKIFRSKKPSKIVKEFCRLIIEDPIEIQNLKDELAKQKLDRENTIGILLSYLDLNLLENFTFQIDELSKECDLDNSEVLQIVERFSHLPGSLVDEEREHYFLGNPVWGKPIILMSEKELFIPIPAMFFSFILSDSMDLGLLEDDFLKFKPKFLEDHVHKMLEDFGCTQKLFKNFKWSSSDQSWENDHIAIYDGHGLFIEDKAGHVSPSALRGAIKRVKYHTKEILSSGSIQSARLATELANWKTGKSTADIGDLAEFTDNINSIHRITVTLHDLHALTLHLDEMKDLGWLGDDFDFAHAMTVSDLRCLMDILGNPIFLFHYLMERKRLSEQECINGDELDWLALYLQTGFNFHSFKKQGYSLNISGMSAEIDQYYEASRIGIKLAKPKPQLAPIWQKIIQTINSRKFDDYINIGIDLLRSVSSEEQYNIQKQLKKLEKSVRKNWRKPGHINSIMISPPGDRDVGVIFYLYPQKLHDSRKENSENVAANFFEQTGFNKCIVIGRNIDKSKDPYAFISKTTPSSLTK